jgi:hypothetical protein
MFSESKPVDRIALFLPITIEAFLYYNFYHREIAWYPPQNSDRARFLSEAYQLQERILTNGPYELWGALWRFGREIWPIDSSRSLI